jgi:hypothetical protein
MVGLTTLNGQQPPVPQQAETQPSCCGPITPRAAALSQFLDNENVEKKWLAHQYVNWETGEPDRLDLPLTPSSHTHCSAFAASVAKQLGVYILRPPEHKASRLATAQADWLASKAGQQAGWAQLASMAEAQRHANLGELVVAVYPSPDPEKSGHIAILRPAELSAEDLAENGPEEIQAGRTNYNRTRVRTGFRFHRAAFPNNILYFAHSLGEQLPAQ